MEQETKTTTLNDSTTDQQKLVGGNYPWDTPSDLEKETEKIMEPKVTTAISEVINKLDRGPIYLEGEVAHPYFKPTLKTLYAKRPNQVVAEATVIIPHHLVDDISEEVVKQLKSKKHTFQTPVNIVYEEQDRAGALHTVKTGTIKEYRFTDIKPNSGSITASIEGIIDWNEK